MQQRVTDYLLRLWLIIAVACFGLMLLHKSDVPSILGRYSPSYTIGLAIVLLTILLASISVVLSSQHKLPNYTHYLTYPIQGFIVIGSSIFIPLFWLFLPIATGQPAIGLFRVYIVMLVIVFTIFLLWRSQNQISLPTIMWSIILLIGIILAIILTIRYIGKVPATLYFDEPLVANYAWTCVHRGVIGVEMLPPRDTAYLVLAAPIAYCIPGFFMQVFGTSLTIARIFGILIIWIATPFVYFTAKRLYGKGAAIIAALVMLLFALSHNHLRSDPYVTFVLAVTLYGYIRAREDRSIWLHLMIGFVLATVIEGHQLGIRFIPIFTLFYIWDYIQVIRQDKRWVWYRPFFAYAIGGLIYAVIFYLIHIVWWAQTDMSGAIDLINFAYDEQLIVGGNVSFWQRIYNNIFGWFVPYIIYHPVEILLLTIGIMGAIWRNQKNDRFLLLFFGFSWVLYIYITPKPTPYYWVHHLPLVALFSGGVIHALTNPDQPKRIPLQAIISILMIFIFYTVHIIDRSQITQNADRVMSISFDIDANLPNDIQVITGHQVYFYGLANRDFYDSNTFSKLTIPQAVERYQIEAPQAIVYTLGLDEHPSLQNYIQQQGMIPIRCYPTNFFSRQTILYVLPQYAEAIPELDCP
ncbi:MAG: glycosyltransferase family 39 protein [Phototrophicaceae bacterium]